MHQYAIIGFGGLGKLHLTNLIKLAEARGDIRLKAVCGADPASFTANVKLNLGDVDITALDLSDIGFYQDYKELIEKEKPDFILSTLPTYLHEEVAVYALERGIHVFSEKPMALTAEGCTHMIDAAIQNDRRLMIGQCLRFNPVMRKLKEYVDSGIFGKVYRAEFTRYSQKPTWTWNNWILDPKYSGGCVLDMHVHDVDLINWLFGMPKAVRSAVTEKQVELEAIFTQYFYDDLLVTSAADWSLPQTFPFTARCMLNFEQAVVIAEGDKITVCQEDKTFTPEIDTADHFMEEMRAFLGMVIDGKECTVTSPASVRDSICLALKEIASAKSGETILL